MVPLYFYVDMSDVSIASGPSIGPQSVPRPITRPTVNIRAKHVRLYDEKTGDYFDLEADDQNSSFILNLNCESSGEAEVGRSGNAGTCTYISPRSTRLI